VSSRSTPMCLNSAIAIRRLERRHKIIDINKGVD
jgi:hypothetical protein